MDGCAWDCAPSCANAGEVGAGPGDVGIPAFRPQGCSRQNRADAECRLSAVCRWGAIIFLPFTLTQPKGRLCAVCAKTPLKRPVSIHAGKFFDEELAENLIQKRLPMKYSGFYPRQRIGLWIVSILLLGGSVVWAKSFVAFESGQVRPMALTPDGQRLLVTNTPDNRLEVFNVANEGLVHAFSVPVGMEPVAVAAASDTEAWVVNHLSDSVSVVAFPDTGPPRVVQTVLVGDEPRDIVIAGPFRSRVFVATAHRGQNSPVDYEPFKIGGAADIWVIDRNRPQEAPGIVTLFGDVPRPLATNAEGTIVYAGIFKSGNQTSVVTTNAVNGRMPPPLTNVEGVDAPAVAQIVQFSGGDWVDAGGQVWSDQMRMDLPDLDVFAIDAMAYPPVQIGSPIRSVGTTLFNMVTNPVSGALYVSNLEARNIVRFEGPGGGGSTVRGDFIENRISIVPDPTTNQVNVRHLNKHIDYERFPGTAEENAGSLATPTQMVVSSDGRTLYVSAFGSSKVGVFDTGELEADTFVPDPANHIVVSGGGPSGLALDEPRGRLYVLTRFNNSVAVVDLATGEEIDSVPMYNPEPPEIVEGRPFLYDAAYTSSRGNSSCAGCHIFGDTDHLAWDLGNPDGSVEKNRNPGNISDPEMIDFHPMKGPMTTQSLRGLADQGPMHWRGDRTGASRGGDPFDEDAAFKEFNAAFEGLIGRTAPLTDAEMQAFTDFALQITYPPNPIRALDNSLTASESAGFRKYLERPADPFQFVRGSRQGFACIECHVLYRPMGFFGTDGRTGIANGNTDVPHEQSIKVPQLRNLYTKVGFFGTTVPNARLPDVGSVIRGFGYTHNGAIDTLPNFHRSFRVFSDGPEGVQEREDIGRFLLAYDSNLYPIVGQQVTLNWRTSNTGDGEPFEIQRLKLMINRALVGECDLIVKGVWWNRSRGLVMRKGGLFHSDRNGERPLTVGALLAISKVPGQALTFTCVPPGSGNRMGIDRDEDGVLDGDEIAAGSSPSD